MTTFTLSDFKNAVTAWEAACVRLDEAAAAHRAILTASMDTGDPTPEWVFDIIGGRLRDAQDECNAAWRTVKELVS